MTSPTAMPHRCRPLERFLEARRALRHARAALADRRPPASCVISTSRSGSLCMRGPSPCFQSSGRVRAGSPAATRRFGGERASAATSRNIPSVDQRLAVALGGRGDIAIVVFRVVLHAPEGAAADSRMTRPAGRNRCVASICGARRAARRSRRDGSRAPRTRSACRRTARCSRPASVSRMRRAKPNSRPRGLARTSPPAAVTATCRPQQLPKNGTPAANTALRELDLARHRRAAVVDVERRAGHGDAVVVAEARRPAEASGRRPPRRRVDLQRRVDAPQHAARSRCPSHSRARRSAVRESRRRCRR